MTCYVIRMSFVVICAKNFMNLSSVQNAKAELVQRDLVRRDQKFKILIVSVGVVILTVLACSFNIGDVAQSWQLALQRMGMWAPVGYVALYTGWSVLCLPGLALNVMAAVLFGPVWGLVWALAGLNLGANAAFWTGRTLGQGRVQRWVTDHPVNEALGRRVVRHEFKLIATLRLVPVCPNNVCNYALSLSRVCPVKYALATALFTIPGTLVMVLGSATIWDMVIV
jgi:uncharacterized membrane protein YdjX (TVP38/TMEM64 family)